MKNPDDPDDLEFVLLRISDKAWNEILLRRMTDETITGDPVVDAWERELLEDTEFDFREEVKSRGRK